MSRIYRIDRRNFLLVTSLAGAAAGLSGCGRVTSVPWRFFSAEEARLVDAICERFIPGEPGSPGASEAQVVNYIDRKLTGFFSELQDSYRDGLHGVERLSRDRFSSGFLGLGPAEQDEVLRSLEEDPELAVFFRTVLEHTEQGFYGDPRHGGNRNFVSWRNLGVPHPPVRGRRPPVGQA